jgi:hypothetical protein
MVDDKNPTPSPVGYRNGSPTGTELLSGIRHVNASFCVLYRSISHNQYKWSPPVMVTTHGQWAPVPAPAYYKVRGVLPGFPVHLFPLRPGGE